MVKFKEEDDIKVEKTINDKIELTASCIQVDSRIRDIISKDFVLCKLNDKEKQFIIEMTNNAFISKKIFKTILAKAKRWNWDKETDKWSLEFISKKEIERIEDYMSSCFDTYMNRLYMIAILTRNVPNNYLVEKVTGVMDDEFNKQEMENQDETRLQSIMKRFKGKRKGGKEGDPYEEEIN